MLKLLVLLLAIFLTLAPDVFAQKRRAASLAEQKMCSDQARHFEGANTFVLNHYDKGRNVCFVELRISLHDPEDRNKYTGVSLDVEDAFEGFRYAECMTDADGKILLCWAAQPTTSEKKEFSSTDAWTDYVMRTYMRE